MSLLKKYLFLLHQGSAYDTGPLFSTTLVFSSWTHRQPRAIQFYAAIWSVIESDSCDFDVFPSMICIVVGSTGSEKTFYAFKDESFDARIWRWQWIATSNLKLTDLPPWSRPQSMPNWRWHVLWKAASGYLPTWTRCGYDLGWTTCRFNQATRTWYTASGRLQSNTRSACQ